MHIRLAALALTTLGCLLGQAEARAVAVGQPLNLRGDWQPVIPPHRQLVDSAVPCDILFVLQREPADTVIAPVPLARLETFRRFGGVGAGIVLPAKAAGIVPFGRR